MIVNILISASMFKLGDRSRGFISLISPIQVNDQKPQISMRPNHGPTHWFRYENKELRHGFDFKKECWSLTLQANQKLFILFAQKVKIPF